jgi:hypothetical protein
MCGSVQHSSRCSHVSGCIIRHREQFMLGNSSFQKRYFLAFPMYCPYLNFRSWVICTSVMVGFVQKLLEIFLLICGLFTHLFMLSNVLARSSLLFFPLLLSMVLGALWGLCMDGHLLYTTSMVWSEHFRALGWACHFQDLFCYLLLLICLLLCCI